MENFHTNQVNNLLRKRWTQEEEVIVLNNIKNFPDNLHEAFRVSARQLENRNVHSIEQKYYNTLKLKYPNVISVGTSKGFSVKNTKNRANKSENQEESLSPILRPVHRIVMEMMQLSPEDLKKIIEFFK
jgi:hypothetical protein